MTTPHHARALGAASRPVLVALALVAAAWVLVSPVGGVVPSEGPGAGDLCGTWVLQQVSSTAELNSRAAAIDKALAVPGVTGLSLRFPWNAVDDDFAMLERGLDIARARGKEFTVRFMAGRHTPDRVFAAGAPSYVLDSGEQVPRPFTESGAPNSVFEREYDAFVGRLAAWARQNGVRLLHAAWYGQDWAELNHGKEVRALAGYTESAWLESHRRLVDIVSRHAGPDLAVELPLSGYGPLSGGESAALADHVISTGRQWYVQANGWGPQGEWGAPSADVEADFDRIWSKSVPRGIQAIQPEDYDWSLLYSHARNVDATYTEVYLPSFTEARADELKDEIAAFASDVCDSASPGPTSSSTTTTRPATTTTTTTRPDPDPGGDTIAPTSPRPIWLAVPTATRVMLSWVASLDDSGGVGYRVEVDGEPVGLTSEIMFVADGLRPDTLHRFDVIAYDAAGNESEPATALVATQSCFLGICF